MASISVTSSRWNERMVQRVVIDGITRPDIVCLGGVRRWGLVPSDALFWLPFARVGDDVSGLHDRQVDVYLGEGDRDPWFRGFITGDGGAEEPNRNRVTLGAVDVLGILHGTTVGEEAHQGIVLYPKYDRVTRTRNRWRISTILTDIFGETLMPAGWRNLVALGDLSGLQTASAVDIELPDLAFIAEPVIVALKRLLGHAPQVGVRTRFAGGKTLLDFYTTGTGGFGGRTISIPTTTESVEQGAVATGYVYEGDIEAIFTRVIGYGRPQETMVTVSTLHETDPLEPVWEGGTFGYPATLPTWTPGESVASATELLILQDPRRGVRGDAIFAREAEFAFRRFRLPQSLRGLRVGQDNCRLDSATGKRMGIQIFRPRLVWPSGYPKVGEEPTESATDWEMIEGATVTDDGFVILPEPAVATFGYTSGGAEDIRPVAVFVTLTLSALDGPGLRYDTGVRGTARFPGLDEDGIVFSFLNPTVRYEQVGSWTGELVEGAAFGCTYWDDLAQAWVTIDPPATVEDCEVVRDDSEFLQNLCEQVLAQRSTRRTMATVRLPMVRGGWKPGDGLFVRNRGIDGKRLMVHQVTVDLMRPRMVIQASDQIPWAAEEALKPVPEESQGNGASGRKGHLNINGPDAGQYRPAAPGVMGVPGYAGQPMGPYLGPPASNQPPRPDLGDRGGRYDLSGLLRGGM